MWPQNPLEPDAFVFIFLSQVITCCSKRAVTLPSEQAIVLIGFSLINSERKGFICQNGDNGVKKIINALSTLLNISISAA